MVHSMSMEYNGFYGSDGLLDMVGLMIIWKQALGYLF